MLQFCQDKTKILNFVLFHISIHNAVSSVNLSGIKAAQNKQGKGHFLKILLWFQKKHHILLECSTESFQHSVKGEYKIGIVLSKNTPVPFLVRQKKTWDFCPTICLKLLNRGFIMEKRYLDSFFLYILHPEWTAT